MAIYVPFFKKIGCPWWGANPGPLDFIYFLIFHYFIAEPQQLMAIYVPMYVYTFIVTLKAFLRMYIDCLKMHTYVKVSKLLRI
jgi:hypothetical protein